MPKKGRKLILVREDLLQEASKITAKEGQTMFAFTNKVFEYALKVHDMQTDLEEVLELFSIMKLGNDLGLAILPTRLLDYMIRELCILDRENLFDEAYKSGIWFGRCLLIKFPEEETIKTLDNVLKKYIWQSLDLSISEKNGKVELKCVSPTLSEEKTRVIFTFLQGIFNALEYRLIKNNCFKGIIQMKFERSMTKHPRRISEEIRLVQTPLSQKSTP